MDEPSITADVWTITCPEGVGRGEGWAKLRVLENCLRQALSSEEMLKLRVVYEVGQRGPHCHLVTPPRLLGLEQVRDLGRELGLGRICVTRCGAQQRKETAPV